MSLIKEALDKAVEEDPDDTSVEESYRNIDEHSQESVEPDPNEESKDQENSSTGVSTGTILLITFLVVLSVVVVGQIVFIMTYFL